MALPWVDKFEYSKSEDFKNEKKAKPDPPPFEYAFYNLIRNKKQKSITLRKIDPKSKASKAKEIETKSKPLDVEVIFENRHRNHPVKFAELMKTYFDINNEYRRLAFFWLEMLKFKGVVGVDKGYLSEEAYLIIFITWLQHSLLITRA